MQQGLGESELELLLAWLASWPHDGGHTWARPCPVCGELVTELHAARHLERHAGEVRA